MDKTSVIFNNKIDNKTIKKAIKSKNKYLKKYGDDSRREYNIGFKKIDTLDFLNTKNVVFSNTNSEFPSNSLIVGNIRMGFGHYRISIAMASCAKALGYEPYWLDLASFDSTGSKMIRYQNDLYSLASRISQKSKLFNKIVWDPLNSEGFRKITYNAIDQKNSELLVPIFKNIPKNIPYIATHVWPAQGAIHAGLTNVVNAIPDNWPMGLHLAQGSIHTVQTPFAYMGYKTLDGFAKEKLNGIPASELKMVGHYIDHELLVNLEFDNQRRIDRAINNKPLRFLLTVGGAGAGYNMYLSMVKHLTNYVKNNKAVVFINFGDHKGVYDKLLKSVDKKYIIKEFDNDYKGLVEFNSNISDDIVPGIYPIFNSNKFEAVYSTNLLMPNSDILVTKPSELAYYPIPKIFMRHIGGHEVYGAICGRELGDSTSECDTRKKLNSMIDTIFNDKEILINMALRINELKKAKYYDGAYECVRLATGTYNEI